MSQTMVFTSIAANYLPKARVLANSLKAIGADCQFCVVLVDTPPAGFDIGDEPFDLHLTLDDLVGAPKQWAFSHSVVELCTAVKGVAVKELLARPGCQRVMYFDPDMAVFGRFEELVEALSAASILLTPHQSEPEASREAVMDNEMASLKHGVFNMGFFGVANTAEGNRFAEWWSERLSHFCEDDISRGLFTDQKWANLVPCFFEDYRVLRSPAFNVATWNITTREVTGTIEEGLSVNGEALGFYHFSGFDSGDQALMLDKYGANSRALNDLRAWYIEACDREGQVDAATQAYGYSCYADGTRISPAERRLYRSRIDLQRSFPNPFVRNPKGDYRSWYESNVGFDEVDPRALTVNASTQTGVALSEFSRWIQRRALEHGVTLKRGVLVGVARLLMWLSRRAS